MYLSHVRLYDFADFDLLVVKDWIDVMWLDSDCDSCRDPLEVLFLLLIVLVFLLQLLINLLDLV